MMLWIGLLFFFRTIRLIGEEYFNRQMVGCSGTKKGKEFLWDIDQKWSLQSITAYGNQNPKLQSP